ncbi:MAG TPA: RDD family protein [Terriglobales bacterium]|nr:RDD family protein [Terriglobales bacterium]
MPPAAAPVVVAAPVVSAAPAASAAQMAPVAAAAPAAAAAPRYAGFWLRVGAIMIDAILLEFVIIPLSFMVGLMVGLAGAGGGADQAALQIVAALLGGLVGLLSYWLYFAFFESSSKQATLGKRVVGIYVTDLGGRRISFARATGRHFSKLISSATLLIGYMMAGWTEKKQALHDMIAGTLVLRRS